MTFLKCISDIGESWSVYTMSLFLNVTLVLSARSWIAPGWVRRTSRWTARRRKVIWIQRRDEGLEVQYGIFFWSWTHILIICYRARWYVKKYYQDDYGEFYTISINITICLWIQNTILNSLTEGHGNLKYGIGLKNSFLFSQTFQTSYLIILRAYLLILIYLDFRLKLGIVISRYLHFMTIQYKRLYRIIALICYFYTDYKRTSLAKYVKILDQFLDGVAQSHKGELLKKSGELKPRMGLSALVE